MIEDQTPGAAVAAARQMRTLMERHELTLRSTVYGVHGRCSCGWRIDHRALPGQQPGLVVVAAKNWQSHAASSGFA